MKKLSVVINTKNAASSLEQTLQSVTFAEEVIVADMKSTDDTIAIAQKFGARIVSITDYGRVEPEARNEANAQATSEWTLQVDADEVIPPELQTKILELINSPADAEGFSFPRKNIIFGQWVQHTGWWPDYQVRLFKTGSLTWTQGVHSKPSTTGVIRMIPDKEELALVHHNYLTIADYVDRLNRYTTLQANESDSKKAPTYMQTWSGEFCRRYFHLQGWQDGQMGLLLSLLQSMYEIVTVAKINETHHQLQGSHSALPEQDLRRLTSDIQYWLADYHVHQATSGITKMYWRLRRRCKL